MTMGVSLSHTTARKVFQTASFDLETQHSINIKSSTGNQSNVHIITSQLQSQWCCANKADDSLASQSLLKKSLLPQFPSFFCCKIMSSVVSSSLDIKFHCSIIWCLSALVATWCPCKIIETNPTPYLHSQYQNGKLKSPREQCAAVYNYI